MTKKLIYSAARIAKYRAAVDEQLGSTKLAAQQLGIKEATLERALRCGAQQEREQDSPLNWEWVGGANKEVQSDSAPWLLFGDAHAPYAHSGVIDFLAEVHEEFGCRERVICTGDLFDFHAMSRHVSELDSLSPDEEYDRAKEWVGKLAKQFPVATWTLGNHDLIPQRQLKEIGISNKLLKGYNELYNVPKTWTIESHFTTLKASGLDVLVEHGVGSGGVNGAINSAIAKGCSFAQGHIHSFPGVTYRASYKDLKMGINTGCLADNTSLAMRYGKYNKWKGVVGCTVVWPPSGKLGKRAMFVPMNLGG